MRAEGTQDFTVIGVDDNAPYRVFYDASKWPAGTKLEFLAVTNDLNGHYSGAFVGGITANYIQTPQLATYKYAVVHYNRPADDYDGWGLHLWGEAIDPTEATEWGAPKALPGRRRLWPLCLDQAGGRHQGRQLHRPQGRREGHTQRPQVQPRRRQPRDLAQAGRPELLHLAGRRPGLT